MTKRVTLKTMNPLERFIGSCALKNTKPTRAEILQEIRELRESRD